MVKPQDSMTEAQVAFQDIDDGDKTLRKKLTQAWNTKVRAMRRV